MSPISWDEDDERARLQRLVWGAVHNAGRGCLSQPRWCAVMDALGVGSSTAVGLCHEHRLNPDDLVGSRELENAQ